MFFLRLSSIHLRKHTTVAYFSFRALSGHRRRSSGNIGARYFCPKIMYEKNNIMPEFYMIIFRKKYFPIFCPEGGGWHAPCPHLLHLCKWTTDKCISHYYRCNGVCPVRNYSAPVVPWQRNFSGAATGCDISRISFHKNEILLNTMQR